MFENNPANGLKNHDVSMEQRKIHINELDTIREFESTVVNISVLCEHKSLVHNFSTKTQKVSESTWKEILKVFKNSPVYLTSNSVCAVCKSASEEQKSCSKEKKKLGVIACHYSREIHIWENCADGTKIKCILIKANVVTTRARKHCCH